MGTRTVRFPASLLEAVRRTHVVGVRAGTRPHRVIAVWAVVVDERVFVRSWARSPDGWNAVLRRERTGSLHVGGRARRIRVVATRSVRLLAEVSRAYAEKYHTPGSRRFVRDMSRAPSRATTLELVPLAAGASGTAARPRRPATARRRTTAA